MGLQPKTTGSQTHQFLLTETIPKLQETWWGATL
jgi:hypothetical protein